VEDSMRVVAPLVDHLQRFCHGHLEKDGGAAAGEMVSYLRSWPGALNLALTPAGPQEPGAEKLALLVIRDVGEFAGFLLDSGDPSRALDWARGNLIVDIESYRVSLGSEPST
jgi:hypothetical protein